MITKKELLERIEELEREVKQLRHDTSSLHCTVDMLIRCHKTIEVTSDVSAAIKIKSVCGYDHCEEAVFTDAAGMVTLKELSRLVIDGKPIKRPNPEPIEITAACGKIKQEEENGNN